MRKMSENVHHLFFGYDIFFNVNMRKKMIFKQKWLAIKCLIFVLLSAFIALFWNEFRSLASIKKIDGYGMFQMTYYGDYDFDNFLSRGAANDRDIELYISRHLLKGIPIKLKISGGGCTAFTARNLKGEFLYGRNFDFYYAPSLQLLTRPVNGYASVSTVNLSFAGYSRDNLPSGLNSSSFLTLASPFLPFDGMNEKGLAIALISVPQARPPFDKNKVTLNTTTAIRLVLDKTATVDEAVNILRQYNIYFSGDIYCHYLIADASGKSVIVEYFNGELQTVTTDEPYQIAANFIAYNAVNIGEGFDEFQRYNTVKSVINNNNGFLTKEQAVSLLAQTGAVKGIDSLQWSVLYNLSALSGVIFAHRKVENLVEFTLISKSPD